MTLATTPCNSSPSFDCSQLWEAYLADKGNTNLRNTLVERYMNIVHKASSRLWASLPDHATINKDDLTSAGFFALIQAVETYSSAAGCKPITYLFNRVRWGLLDEMRRINHSRSKWIHSEKWERIEATPITEDEVGIEQEEGGEDRIDPIDTSTLPPDDSMVTEDNIALIMRYLTERERSIVRSLYLQHNTMLQTACNLGISEGRVSQVHSRIMALLRDKLCHRREELMTA